MTRHRTTQIAGGILCLISLFVSAVSACACSRHVEAQPVEQSDCHSHAAGPDAQKKSAETSTGPKIDVGECCCVAPTPKLAAKSEKITSDAVAAGAAGLSVDTVFSAKAEPESVILARPSFLTDSFYNLTPGRAPPAPVKQNERINYRGRYDLFANRCLHYEACGRYCFIAQENHEETHFIIIRRTGV